jgi:hypothetical protein
MIQLPEKYKNAKILEESRDLVKIETRDGREFWIRKNESTAPTPSPAGVKHRGLKPKKIGFRDSDGTIYRNAEGQERAHVAFAARPRGF